MLILWKHFAIMLQPGIWYYCTEIVYSNDVRQLFLILKTFFYEFQKCLFLFWNKTILK